MERISRKNLDESRTAQLKRLMQLMIDRVDVFPDDSHGCILKAVRFKIPLRDMDTGKPFDTFEITGVTDENGRQVFLPIEEQDETVVLLSKGEINSKKVRVEFSLEDMDMSGFQNDATYGQIKERVLQQTGLKVSSLYIAQVKQKYGIIERENYNKPKSENAKQPKCPPEKEAAITEALKFFGMI